MFIGGKGTGFWSDLYIGALGDINITVGEPENLVAAKAFRNSFLATKVSFFNQIFDLCESMNDIDYDVVRKFITIDERIGDGHSSVTDQRGFGGHCFPKDTQAIVNTAKEKDVDLSVLNEAIKYNNKIRKD